MIERARYSFTPQIGKVYYLYRIESGCLIMSALKPTAFRKEFLGSYEYTENSDWKKVDQ